MPVFISEVVFRGAIGPAAERKPEAEKTGIERELERDRLVEDCVAEVMRLMRRAQER